MLELNLFIENKTIIDAHYAESTLVEFICSIEVLLNEWFNANKLSVNREKTADMHQDFDYEDPDRLRILGETLYGGKSFGLVLLTTHQQKIESRKS